MWQNRSKKFYILVSVAVVLAVAVLIYFAFYFYKEKLAPGTSSPSETPALTETLSEGFLILSLRPGVENATSSIYFYDLSKKELTFISDKNSLNINGHGLPSGIAVTSSRFLAATGTADENIFQLYQVDMKNNFMKKQITNSRTFSKRHPEWSPNGKQIAFMAKSNLSKNATSSNPDDWSVYVTDTKGNEKLLGPGSYPQWAPDSKKLVALRSDGLYLYDLEKQTSAKVWNMADGSAVLRMNIDVSRDGSMLAWSVPNDRQIILAKISSWEPFEFKIYKTIDNILAFWPVFSPKAQYLAAITVEEKENSTINLYTTIYNIETLEMQNLFNLNSFSVNSMTLTDWGGLK